MPTLLHRSRQTNAQSTDVGGAIFDPETAESIEAGAKLSLLGGALNGTLAVFQLTKSNVLATDANNPGYSLAIGKARSRGVEFDLAGRLPGRLDVMLTYAYVDAEARSGMQDPSNSFRISPGETGTDFRLPAHTLFRLFGSVDGMEHLELCGAVANLFDAEWYASSYSPLWVQPGAPRTATIGLRASF